MPVQTGTHTTRIEPYFYSSQSTLTPRQSAESVCTSYVFGFNGKEKVDELYESSGSAYDFGARMYDSRLGRFMSLDPLKILFDYKSNYSFADNSPIDGVDYNGNFRISSKLLNRNERLKKVVIALHNLANQDDETVLGNEFFKVFLEYSGLSDANDGTKLYYIRDIFTMGTGPYVKFVYGLSDKKMNRVAGKTSADGIISINRRFLRKMLSEKDDIKLTYMASLLYTFWHEGIHYVRVKRPIFTTLSVVEGCDDCPNCCDGAKAELKLHIPGANSTGIFDMREMQKAMTIEGVNYHVPPFTSVSAGRDRHFSNFSKETVNCFFQNNRIAVEEIPQEIPKIEKKLIIGTEGYK